MRVLKAKNAGISLRKCGYYAGISKCAIPFPPFLCIQNCSLSTPFISQLFLVQSRKKYFFPFFLTKIFNDQHMMFKRQLLWLKPFCKSFKSKKILGPKKKHIANNTNLGSTALSRFKRNKIASYLIIRDNTDN